MARIRLHLVAMTATAAALAAPTTAAAVTTGCDGLQGALDDPANAVVTIAEGEECHAHFDLPSRPILLEGAGQGATLSGDVDKGRLQILSGVDVGATTIRNLTFVDGLSQGDGGAIEIDGDSAVTIENSTFLDNEAGSDGGAVDIDNFQVFTTRGEADPIVLRGNVFEGNTADDEGGAANIDPETFTPVVLEDNTFSGNDSNDDGGGLEIEDAGHATLTRNTFTDNDGRDAGGGARIEVCTADLTGNTFAGNRVVSADGERVRGGGLYLDGDGCLDRAGRGDGRAFNAIQTDNTFTGNSLEAGFGTGEGGGEYIEDMTTQSTGDTFVGNAIKDADDALGGGLIFEGSGAQPFTARNLVAAGNRLETPSDRGRGQLAPRRRGGGLALFGFDSEFRIEDSTIEGNSAAGGSGIAGERLLAELPQSAADRTAIQGDKLVLENSILFGNTDAQDIPEFPFDGEIDGFIEREVSFSDVCVEGQPHADADGTAPNSNLCVDPQLAGPVGDGNVDQAASSPTVDRGEGSLVDADLTADYAGDARIINRVDMGADEFKPPAPVTPPPPPAPAAAAPQAAVLGAQQRSCVSRRAFTIRIRVPKGQRVISARVLVNGKRVQVVRGRRLRAPVVLRGLPKGRFTVRITLRLADGTRVSGVRRYNTCIPRLPGDGPPRL